MRKHLTSFCIASFFIFAAIPIGALLLADSRSAPMDRVNAQDELVVWIDELDGSGVSGDATFIDNGDGTTTVDILLLGAIGGHPVHIHAGSCDALGDILYALTDVNASGGSVTVIPVSLSQLVSQAPLAVNVHRSAADIGAYIACGTLNEQPAASPAPDEPATALPQLDPLTASPAEVLYVASNAGEFTDWQGDFWQHDGDLLRSRPSSQAYITAPYQFTAPIDYALEAEIRITGYPGEIPACSSYFGFLFALENPAEGIFAGLDGLGDPSSGCAGRFAVWTPWIKGAEPLAASSSGNAPDTNWHTYRLEVRGSDIRLLIDGNQVFQSSDPSYASPGTVGIVSGNLALELRRVEIAAVAGIATPPAPANSDSGEAPALPVLVGAPIAEVSDTEQWSRYESDLIGIRIDYPSEWTVVESADGFLISFIPPEFDPNAPSPGIFLYFDPEFSFDPNFLPLGVTEPQPITVAGIDGRQYQDSVNAIPLQGTYVELPLWDGALFLSATIGPAVDLRPVFEQMLETMALRSP